MVLSPLKRYSNSEAGNKILTILLSSLRHILIMPADIPFHNPPACFPHKGDDLVAPIGYGYFGFYDAEGLEFY